MCYPVRCELCSKITWAGCGRHVRIVEAAVPSDDWCPGHADVRRRRGFVDRLLGR